MSNYWCGIKVQLNKKVNELTPALFSLGSTPEKMNNLGFNQIYEIIKPLGLNKQKANRPWINSNSSRNYSIPSKIRPQDKLSSPSNQSKTSTNNDDMSQISNDMDDEIPF